MKVLKNWKETWGSLVIILIPLLVSIDYIKNLIDSHKILWIVLSGFFVWAWIQTNKNFKSKNDFEEQIQSLSEQSNVLKSNFDAIPENMIKNLFKYFQLGNNDRITVYRVKDSEWFIPVGRFSDNPNFKKNGRTKYPINEGYIGKCWSNEEVIERNLPNFNKGHARYLEQVSRRSNVNEETLKNLEMKSRSFYCRRLAFNGEEALAVIVIESLNPTFSFNTDQLKGYLDGPFGIALIDAIKNNLPIGKEE